MSIKKILLSTFRKCNVFLRLCKKELKLKTPLAFSKKLWCYRRGFFSYSYILYDLKNNNYKDYISDIQENIKSRQINQDLVYIDNKILFPLFLKPFIPVNYEQMILMRGSISFFNDKSPIDSIEKLLKEAKRGAGFVLKPVDGASGIGVFKISYVNDSFLLNQQEKTYEELINFLKTLNNYLISPLIKQAAYAEKLYAKSVNTVRIITMIDPVSKEPFIAAAAHRIGNERSFPVDNCAMGSFTANIDIEKGVLGKAIITLVESPESKWHSVHPDSGNPIEGVEIPNWSIIKKEILEIAANVSFLPYIGWDIVVIDDGFTIIEGNDGPDLKLHQVHQPLLINPRVKSFYQTYKVIR